MTQPSRHLKSDVKVSVVVLTYKHREYLAQCLDSILLQETTFKFDIIIGHDASPDDASVAISEVYAKSHSDKIILLKHETNVGGTRNYFLSTKLATGEYIAHIDGDDYMLPGKLQAQSDYLDDNPDVSLVGHHMYDLENGNLKDSPAAIRRKINTDELLLTGCPFCHSSIMYRRSAIRTDSRDKETVDFYIYLGLSFSGCVSVIPAYYGVYRKNLGMSTRREYKGTIASAYMDAIDFASENQVCPNVIHKARCLMRMRMAVNFIHGGDFASFRTWCRSVPGEEWPYLSIKHRLLMALSHSKTLSLVAIRTYLQYADLIRRIRYRR
jgi:glycosyltransferase involved in cell wall biosynthesis